MDRQTLLNQIATLEPKLRQLHVLQLKLFGSFARDEAQQDSDVDLLVTFSPDFPVTLFRLAEVQLLLEETLGRKVDLVLPETIIPALKPIIDKEAIRAA